MLTICFLVLILIGTSSTKFVADVNINWTIGSRILCQNLSKNVSTTSTHQLFYCDFLLSAQQTPIQCVTFVAVPHNVHIDWFMVMETSSVLISISMFYAYFEQGVATATNQQHSGSKVDASITLRMDLNYCGADDSTVAASLATGVLLDLTTTSLMSHPLCSVLGGQYQPDLPNTRSVHLPLDNGCVQLVEGTVFFKYMEGGGA